MDSSFDFGVTVAYVLPGFVVLASLAPFSPMVMGWLQPLSQTLSLGPPLFSMLLALTLGMIASVVRWLLIDHIHQWTGIEPPVWNDARLGQRVDAFSYLVTNHYRYAQFYGNTLIALIFGYAINRWAHSSPLLGAATDVGVIILCAVLFVGSRDSMSKYYSRTSRVIGKLPEEGDEKMTNGNHPDDVSSGVTRPPMGTKQPPKPAPHRKPNWKKARAESNAK